MDMAKIKIGIIGAGKIASWHLGAYRKIENVEASAIANLNSERGLQLKKNFKISQHFKSGFDLINYASLDAVDICTPASTHADYILAALNRGLHVYVEKPICNSLEDLKEIISLNSKQKRVLFNGFNYKFLPEIEQITKIIQSQKLGKIRYVRFNRESHSSQSAYMFSGKEKTLFWEFDCHFIDLLNHWGLKNPVRAYSVGSSAFAWSQQPDITSANLEFADGAYAQINTAISTVGVTPDILIIGNKASLKLKYGKIFIYQNDQNPSLVRLILQMFNESLIVPFRVLHNPFLNSCRHFIECIRNDSFSFSSETSAYECFKIASGLEESYFKKKIISFDALEES